MVLEKLRKLFRRGVGKEKSLESDIHLRIGEKLAQEHGLSVDKVKSHLNNENWKNFVHNHVKGRMKKALAFTIGTILPTALAVGFFPASAAALGIGFGASLLTGFAGMATLAKDEAQLRKRFIEVLEGSNLNGDKLDRIRERIKELEEHAHYTYAGGTLLAAATGMAIATHNPPLALSVIQALTGAGGLLMMMKVPLQKLLRKLKR